jgi:hypothetical protein
MRRKPIEHTGRLENDERVRNNLIRLAPGIDLDDDRQEPGHNVRFARRAEKKPAVAANAGEPGVAVQLRMRLRSTLRLLGIGARRLPNSIRVS